MANRLELFRGISQAIANSYDGAHDERYSYDGEERKVGLKREQGDPVIDMRVNDGFKVKLDGDRLCIHYHAEMILKNIKK